MHSNMPKFDWPNIFLEVNLLLLRIHERRPAPRQSQFLQCLRLIIQAWWKVGKEIGRRMLVMGLGFGVLVVAPGVS